MSEQGVKLKDPEKILAQKLHDMYNTSISFKVLF